MCLLFLFLLYWSLLTFVHVGFVLVQYGFVFYVIFVRYYCWHGYLSWSRLRSLYFVSRSLSRHTIWYTFLLMSLQRWTKTFIGNRTSRVPKPFLNPNCVFVTIDSYFWWIRPWIIFRRSSACGRLADYSIIFISFWMDSFRQGDECWRWKNFIKYIDIVCVYIQTIL